MLVVRRYIASTKQVDEKIEQMRSLSNFPVCGNLIKSNLKRAIKMGERGRAALRCGDGGGLGERGKRVKC
jgi:hypothetical protein